MEHGEDYGYTKGEFEGRFEGKVMGDNIVTRTGQWKPVITTDISQPLDIAISFITN